MASRGDGYVQPLASVDLGGGHVSVVVVVAPSNLIQSIVMLKIPNLIIARIVRPDRISDELASVRHLENLEYAAGWPRCRDPFLDEVMMINQVRASGCFLVRAKRVGERSATDWNWANLIGLERIGALGPGVGGLQSEEVVPGLACESVRPSSPPGTHD